MKTRLSLFSRWWIAGTLVVLAITAILEPGLFLGDMQAACDLNMLLRMDYYSTSLLIACGLLFMLANHNGNRMFWMGFCFVLSVIMALMFRVTDADIFLFVLLPASGVGVASCIRIEERR